MKFGLYPRLALAGIRKNKRLYIPYLLTCTGMAMMYYIIIFLQHNEMLDGMRGGTTASTILALGGWVVAIFACIFLFYTHSFLLRRRKKEFGLYNILGMGRRHLVRIEIWETIFVAIGTTAAGLLCGIAFSKLAELGLMNLMHGSISYVFSISAPAIMATLLIFGVIHLLLLLRAAVAVGRSSAIQLLQSEAAGEKPPRANWFLGLLGFVMLGAAYYMAVTIREPLMALSLFFVAVILVMLGTYCLFTAGSIALLKRLRANKSFYYQTRHFTAISGLLYRMKQNAVGLANICILACMVLVTVSGTLCLYLGAEKSLDGRYPDDILVTQTLKDDTDPAATLDLVQRTVADAGRQMADLRYETSASFHARYSGNTLLTDMSQSGLLTEITVLTAEEYSRLTGETVALGENQVLAYADGDFQLPETFFYEYEEAPIQVKARLDSFPAGDSAIVTNEVMLGLVADGTLAEHLMNTDLARRTFRIHLNTDGADSEKLACAKAVLAVSDGRYGVASRQEMAEEFYAMYGGFLFLGIFLGLLFLMATVLIIYYKQVSEGYEDQRRYQIMQQVGMSRREVGASIRGQILLVFFLPLLTAGLHILAAFPMLCRILELFGLHEVGMFALCTAGTLAVFAAVYALVYGLTARTYERIVGGEA